VFQKSREGGLERGIFMRKLFSKPAYVAPANVYEDVKMAKGEYIMRIEGMWNWVMA
jgi:hypothetical protein